MEAFIVAFLRRLSTLPDVPDKYRSTDNSRRS
jgi:hypothetical protein